MRMSTAKRTPWLAADAAGEACRGARSVVTRPEQSPRAWASSTRSLAAQQQLHCCSAASHQSSTQAAGLDAAVIVLKRRFASIRPDSGANGARGTVAEAASVLVAPSAAPA